MDAAHRSGTHGWPVAHVVGSTVRCAWRGPASAHAAVASAQRLANRQPAGQSAGAGTVPGIDGSRSGTGRPSATCGFAREQGGGVGVRRLAEHLRDRAWLHDLARVHDGHLVAQVGDDAEVVADDDAPTGPSSRTRARSRLRISACTVTSSAVVGSSAMSSCGEPVSASAMHTRWAMPPDSWCG